MHNPIFQDHFTKVEAQVASAFTHLPEMKPEDWTELHGIENRINELWLADSATLNDFREACGRYKMFWFKKKDSKPCPE